MPENKKTIYVPEVITVKGFAEKAGLPVTVIISELMKSGVLATINETIDFDTASIIGDDLNLDIKPDLTETSKVTVKETNEGKNLIPRPPVVTIMGHVDHGKTTLLDHIRKEHVAESESGGITQHISAYQLTLPETKRKDLKNKTITLIDTPGHAAFSAIRLHGAAITDIVVIIVAANDGVMPQTLEVIEQAKSQNVPIIVAINKIDLPDSDIMKVKQQLSDHGLVPEDWGGKTIMVPISAKTGQGVDDLLEMILLQADLMDLKADPDAPAVGVVIESHMEKGTGPIAIVLVENGSLHRGDPVAIGSAFGKIRILEDYIGKPVGKALPSTPVRVGGLRSMPDFGDRLLTFKSEKEARDNALKYLQVRPKVRIATAKHIAPKEGEEEVEKISFNLLVKCDVGGSLEAVKKSIDEISSDLFEIKIIAEGVGDITESDITLAGATGAWVVGFRVKVLGAAKRIAEKDGITVRVFNVIYEIVDYLKSQISDALPPEIIEEELGEGEVLAIFVDDRKTFVAGGRVDKGKISVHDEIKFFQGKTEKYRSKITTLRREKSEVKECEVGTECGFGLAPGANIAVGDKFIAFKKISKPRVI